MYCAIILASLIGVTNIMDDREEQNMKRIIDYINGEDIE